MRLEIAAVFAVVASASAQAFVGKAYGFAQGVTGGGSAAAVTQLLQRSSQITCLTIPRASS